MFENPGFSCGPGLETVMMGRATLRPEIVRSRRLLPADERGVALVEFALVLPLLLVLLLGMIDVGKAVNYWNDETHLANEAARYAAVNNSPTKNPDGTPTAQSLNTAILGQADTTELKNGGTTSIPAGQTICIWFPNKATLPSPNYYAVGQPVQIVVTTQYHWLGYLVGKGLLPSSTLRATSTMRIEQTYRADGTDAYTTGPATASKTDGSGTC
jgi:Flp pilus assembly protein TadG